MECYKTRTLDNGIIIHSFRNADGTGTMNDAIPVTGGYTHYDFVAMKRARQSTGDERPILSSDVYATAEVAACAGVANKTASAGNMSYIRGADAELRDTNDGPRGYGR